MRWYRLKNQETQDMIQWNIYVPERAKPAYRIPYEDISIDRTDFAVVKIHGTSPNIFGIQSKVRVDHPCLPPIEFTKGIITKAQAVERIMLFPNHESLWKKASALAREYTGTDGKPIRLVSNRCRKFFEDRADSISQKLRPSIAAFIMGDRTKLAATGHLPLFYNPMLLPMERERFIQEYKASEITKLLDLNNY